MNKVISFQKKEDIKRQEQNDQMQQILEEQNARIRQARMKLNNGGTIKNSEWLEMFRNMGRATELANEMNQERINNKELSPEERSLATLIMAQE